MIGDSTKYLEITETEAVSIGEAGCIHNYQQQCFNFKSSKLDNGNYLVWNQDVENLRQAFPLEHAKVDWGSKERKDLSEFILQFIDITQFPQGGPPMDPDDIPEEYK